MDADQCLRDLDTILDQHFPEISQMALKNTSHENNLDIRDKVQDMKEKMKSIAGKVRSMKSKIQELEKQISESKNVRPDSDTSTLDSVSGTGDVNFTSPIDEVGHNSSKITIQEQQKLPKLNWRNEPNMIMPFGMSRNIQVVVKDQMLYIGAGDAERRSIENEFKVMSCNLTSQKWKEIPYAAKWFAMVVIDNKLTLVGGRDMDRREVNTLGVLDNDNWTNPYPPMPTSRFHCSATSYKAYLIVAGGTTVDRDTLSVIEILNLDTMQWQQVCDASIPFYSMKSVTLNDTWYLMGGYHGHTVSHDVFVVKLDDLVANHESLSTWTKLPRLRCFYSCPVLIQGTLLAVGGRVSAYESVDTIYMYDCNEKKWSLAGKLPCAINNCACAIISNIMHIFGGYDGTNRQTSIHMCSLDEQFCS